MDRDFQRIKQLLIALIVVCGLCLPLAYHKGYLVGINIGECREAY